MIIHANPQLSLCHDELSISSRLNTKDSGCQTDDFLITAPSRRRIRAQRGQGIPASLSHSTGNISSLPDRSDSMYTSTSGGRLRSRSLPREGGRIRDEMQDDSDEDDEEDDEDEDEELSPYEAEDFLPVPGQHILKDEEESTDDQAMPELQLGSLKRGVTRAGSPDHSWIERGRSRLPRKTDMGSCEISSSSDTFSSPIHSVSTTGVLGGQIDHKEDHQSSSGNWSGSSSTCPSQTSETLPPASSPPLTGSSHCDSELSLNTAPHIIDDTTGFIIDPYQSDRAQTQGHRSSSFTSSATDQMDDAGVSTASEGEWNYTQDQPEQDQPCLQDFSPKRSRDNQEGDLECRGYRATYEGFSGKSSGETEGTNLHYTDTEGIYATMHFDCRLKESRSYVYNYAAECGPQGSNTGPSEGGYAQTDYRGTRTLGRQCLSLRKPKAKPPPPKRSSSLKESSSMEMLDQSEPKTLICDQPLPLSSREMKLELDLAGSVGPSEMLGLEPETLGAWGVESSREVDDASPFCSSDTHSFKDEGAVQSDYADLWLLNDLRSNDPYRSLSNSSTATGTTVIECVKSPETSESKAARPSSKPNSPSHPPAAESDFKLSSPEKLAGLASPSSGYSSQSETPTSSFPSAFFPNPLSPTTGKRKPKVPERKSSLSSLQQQHLAGCSSRRDAATAELLPAAPPPSQLDLSALHTGPPKPPPYRIHTLHHNKQRAAAAAAAAAEARAVAAANAAAAASASSIAGINTAANANPDAASSAHMAITPTVLRSVQLRSIGPREQEQFNTDTLTRPRFHAQYSENRQIPSTKPPAYKSHDAPSQELSDTGASSGENIQATEPPSQPRQKLRQQRLVPGTYWAMTAFRTPVDVTGDDDDLIPQSGTEPDSRGALGSSGYQNEPSVLRLKHQVGGGDAEAAASLCLTSTMSPPAQSETTASCDFVLFNSPDKVPARTLEALHTYEISDARSREDDYEPLGGQARSASQDNRDEGSTPDTEDYFSKGELSLNPF